MTKIYLFISFLLIGTLSSFAQKNSSIDVFGNELQVGPNGFIRCVSEEYMEYMRATNPEIGTKEEEESIMQQKIAEYQNQMQTYSTSGNITIIPVVVHVIHNGEAYGVGANITDEQVQSQITVLNQDFRKMVNTPGFNNHPAGADIQIQFALATSDPNGNPTNGIDRVNLCTPSWSPSTTSSMKSQTYWDPTQYYNIWVCNLSGGILGFAPFPSTSTSSFTASQDGPTIGYQFFGSSDLGSFNLSSPYDKGRTATHEIGHSFSLFHIWGDGGCSASDLCDDTPNALTANYGCPTLNSCVDNINGTNPNDMVENYMDYSDDTCMNIFTNDQKTRIQAVLNSYPRRVTLKTSTKDLPITLFANDAEVIIANTCSSGGDCNGSTQKIYLYNRGTSNLTSATLTHSLNGGTATTYNWSGNLATHKYAEIDLPVSYTTAGTLTVSVTSVNGTTDQRASNNSDSSNIAASGPSTFTSPNYVTVAITTDGYPQETTWNIKNSSGTTMASGGPYTGANTPYSQNVALPNNACYTFTINDSYSDGICCSEGNGSYSLKTESGATMTSGGQFSDSESFAFIIGSLGVDDINVLDEKFTVYPNPSTGTFTIYSNSLSEGKASIQLYDISGKIVHSETFLHTGGILEKGFQVQLPQGSYIVQLATATGTLLTEKILIK